jgi:hypothetical protein
MESGDVMFQTSLSWEIILWFWFGMLAWLYLIITLDRLTGFLDGLTVDDDHLFRDERTEMGVSSRDPMAQGGGIAGRGDPCPSSTGFSLVIAPTMHKKPQDSSPGVYHWY